MIKNKKIFLIIFLIFTGSIYFLGTSYSSEIKTKEVCEDDGCIQSRIDECNKSDNKRSIEEFVCIDGTPEEIAYQIVIDNEFTRIDKEIDEYLTTLETDKDKFFGPEAEFTYFDAVDEIERKFAINGEYYLKYENICGVNIIDKTISYLIEEQTSIDVSKDMFKGSVCMNLASSQLYIYKQVAYDILLLNKAAVRKDIAKKYVQQERTKYDELIDTMLVNIGYIERISKKWSSKTKNVYPK